MEFGHNIKLNICLFEDLPVRMEKREAKKKKNVRSFWKAEK